MCMALGLLYVKNSTQKRYATMKRFRKMVHYNSFIGSHDTTQKYSCEKNAFYQLLLLISSGLNKLVLFVILSKTYAL